MKIGLINPPQILLKAVGIPAVFPPIGLAYIAAVLEKEHEVFVIDANAAGWRNLKEVDGKLHSGLSFEEIGSQIRERKPDIVGITVPFSVNAESAYATAAVVKSVDKSILTILGGPHPSIRPLDTLSNYAVDYVVIGEGEDTIVELINKIDSGALSELDQVNGIGYKNDNKLLITPPRPLIKDLDKIPFPARHLLPMEEYFASIRARRGSRHVYNYNSRWANMITSRGCPFACNFCSVNITMGKQFRARSADNVIKEIQELVTKYDIRHIDFEDDNLTFEKKRLAQICDYIVEKQLGITWATPNGVRADILDDNLVARMKKAGCKRVFVAPESGSQRVLRDIIGKAMDLKKVEEAVALFKKHGIIVDASFVIGSIGEKGIETKAEILETIQFAKKLKRLGMDGAGFHIATPLYGTSLYETAKQKGYLRKDVESASLSSGIPLIETPEWTGAELLELQKMAYDAVCVPIWQKTFRMFKQIFRLSPSFVAKLRELYWWAKDIGRH